MDVTEGELTNGVIFPTKAQPSKHDPSHQVNVPLMPIEHDLEECSSGATMPIHQPPDPVSTHLMTYDLEVTQGSLPSREEINQRAQQVIDQINEKRKRDTTLLNDFRKVLQNQVTKSCDTLEERMYQVYEANGKTIQSKLQELFSTLDRVASIEEELDHFKEALGLLYTDIQHSPVVPT
ncbi:synaptonemal complex central element protein 2-like [Diadema antillarum]|uniref:synaptonemal complex central element protein 2-like n=1 Tax=Diadema antillarum TaxID=105358 RepID=UPI003A848840